MRYSLGVAASNPPLERFGDRYTPPEKRSADVGGSPLRHPPTHFTDARPTAGNRRLMGAVARAAARGDRRRSFAIISHPDAGKTTLTEKFLLYGGALQLAGSVTARKTSAPPPRTGWRWRNSAASRFPRPCCSSNTRTARQHPRHAGAQGFLRGHLPRAHRRGRRGDGGGRGQGHRSQTRKLFEVCRRAACRSSPS
jgi:hypothetical protein